MNRPIRSLPVTVATLVGAALGLLLAPAGLGAQDGHYWTEQYGTEGSLLGGAVLGSAADLSAVYYNPGAVSLLNNPSVLLNIEAFQFDFITTTDRTMATPDMRSFRAEASPGMVAITLPRAWALGERIALSVLSRRRFNTRLEGSRIDPRTVDELDADEIGRSAARNINADYTENWIGVTWSRQLREGLGFGVTTNFALRSQGFRLGDTDQRIAAGPLSATAASGAGYDYWDLRLLWRLGVQYERNGYSWGVVMTTPSIPLFGSGNAQVNDFVVGDLGALFPESEAIQAAYAEEGLSTEVRSSWSVGGGGNLRLSDQFDLHLSAEWFAPVDDHEVLETTPFRRQLPGDTADLKVVHGLNQVLNVGVGLKYVQTAERALYAAFTTDFSAAKDVEDAFLRTEIALWDLYHLTVGAAAEVFGSDFTLGVRYSRGRQPIGELIRPLPAKLQTPDDVGTDVVFHRLKLMVGVNLNLFGGGDPSDSAETPGR